jgi:hypothetical protein
MVIEVDINSEKIVAPEGQYISSKQIDCFQSSVGAIY